MNKVNSKNTILDHEIVTSVLGKYQNGVAVPVKKMPFNNIKVVISFIKEEKPQGNGPAVLKALNRAQKHLGEAFKDFDLDKVRSKIDKDVKKHFTELNWK